MDFEHSPNVRKVGTPGGRPARIFARLAEPVPAMRVDEETGQLIAGRSIAAVLEVERAQAAPAGRSLDGLLIARPDGGQLDAVLIGQPTGESVLAIHVGPSMIDGGRVVELCPRQVHPAEGYTPAHVIVGVPR